MSHKVPRMYPDPTPTINDWVLACLLGFIGLVGLVVGILGLYTQIVLWK